LLELVENDTKPRVRTMSSLTTLANGSVVKALADAATPVRLTHVDCVQLEVDVDVRLRGEAGNREANNVPRVRSDDDRFPIADPASPKFDTFGNAQGQPLGIDDVGVRLSPAGDMAIRAGLGFARLYCPDDDLARHGSKMILPK
jgi:hypothetical protein